MSADGDPPVRRQAAASINRFVKENKTYEPVRPSLERLLVDPDLTVKESAYRAIAYPPIPIDDQLLKLIMANADWEAEALGDLLNRLGEDQLQPYESQIVAAYFEADRVTDRSHGLKRREAVTRAAMALPHAGLQQIFDRCPDIGEMALRTMGGNIDSDSRRMPSAMLLKVKATWAPCALRRMQNFGVYSMITIARGLASLNEAPAAAAELDKRLASPRPNETANDQSNLQNYLRWLRQSEGDFEKQWAKAVGPQH
jgi:hypothetical protein